MTKTVEDNIVTLSFISKKCASHFAKEPTNVKKTAEKITRFQIQRKPLKVLM